MEEQNPSPDQIQDVMDGCDCTAEKAVYLLGRANNDVARAKRHHYLYTRFLQSPTPPTPSTPSSESTTPGRDQDQQSNKSSSHSFESKNFREEEPAPRPESRNSQPPAPSKTPQSPVEGGEGASLHPSEELNSLVYGMPSEMSQKSLPLNLSQPQPALDTKNATPESSEIGDPVSTEPVEWDFSLPLLPHPGDLSQVVTEENDTFSPSVLAAAVQHNAAPQHVRNYLDSYGPESVKSQINDEVDGIPPVFYAVSSHNDSLVRLLLDYGADPSALHGLSGVPLLAFSIIHGEISQMDTSKIVAILLSYGASPKVIPKWIYSPYDRDQSGNPPSEVSEDEHNNLTAWCTEAAAKKLSKANITQRYYLDRAAKTKPPSEKRRQVARLRNCERLLGIPYFIIGQPIATDFLIRRLVAYLTLPSKRPLVLCFAGPSGHGKTELARQLGMLLSLSLEVVDCTVMNREIELWGPRAPYSGSENGSPLNNFLAAHSGRRCIVFMDEFEKTTREIHQSLLVPWDNGEYRDRRNNNRIDCSNTIWIMATNALDETILDFCLKNEAIVGQDQSEQARLSKKLSRQLQEDFLQNFDAPVTGRVSEFVPFLPFTRGEQAVITHKCLLELADDLRRPVSLSKGREEQLVGNIRLSIRKDATVCLALAQEHYHKKLGARSLKAGAKKVEQVILDAYLDEDEEIKETGEMRDFFIDYHAGEIIAKAGRTIKA
uniref:AAA+ ATPase domain-containing protein n=1 Tax=Bionectria ochroleuca TaxID=29856 RepID=A0A8H7N4B2_BIOOC